MSRVRGQVRCSTPSHFQHNSEGRDAMRAALPTTHSTLLHNKHVVP